MDKKKLNRKDFLKLATMTAATALASGLISKKKALAMEHVTDVTYYDGPSIGQPGYERRVAKLFKASGLPQKATRI